MPEGVTAGITLLANRYEIGEVIGRGGMATVHLGNDTRLGRKVAVKLLKPSLANDPAFRTRFRQEAQAAALATRLQHRLQRVGDLVRLGHAARPMPGLGHGALAGADDGDADARQE